MRFFSLNIVFIFTILSVTFSNPTGLIDDLALGINRHENPDELIVERKVINDKPYLALSQSGNLLFQVNSNGNIEWAGVLNTAKTTFTGNLAPEKEGYTIGTPSYPWTQLYIKNYYLPLTLDEKPALSSETVDSTLEQLVAVTSGNNNTEISLQIRSSKIQSITKPIEQNYFNASHLLSIMVKRLQDDKVMIHKLEEKLKITQEENLKNIESINKVREIHQKLEGQLKSTIERQFSDSKIFRQEIEFLKLELNNIKNKIKDSKKVIDPILENKPNELEK